MQAVEGARRGEALPTPAAGGVDAWVKLFPGLAALVGFVQVEPANVAQQAARRVPVFPMGSGLPVSGVAELRTRGVFRHGHKDFRLCCRFVGLTWGRLAVGQSQGFARLLPGQVTEFFEEVRRKARFATLAAKVPAFAVLPAVRHDDKAIRAATPRAGACPFHAGFALEGFALGEKVEQASHDGPRPCRAACLPRRSDA